MFKPILASALLSMLLFSCHNAQPVSPKMAEKKKFHLPVVLQNAQEKATPIEAKAVTPVSFPYLGKYQFCDTLKPADNGVYKGEMTRIEDLFLEKSGIGKWDSLNTDGFQIIADYKTSILYRSNPYVETSVYFPVYIVNETDTPKLFFGKDRHAWGVQEAKDTSDYASWYSIECWNWSGDGNGSFAVKIRPGEFAMILAPKYKGSQTGSMRLRLQIDQSTYVSLPYEGAYHQEQFYFDMSSPDLYPARHAKSFFTTGIYGAAFKQPGKH
ncbi:hypothetical protein SAMN05428949_5165 [Chitinophaga sp. YR627]|nr:hypothetical protein SAMN05428949_5165 [Chitinophaga sp. YR627]